MARTGIIYPAKQIQMEAIAGFLDSIQFTHFCTFTTRKPISLGSTRRIAENVGRYIDAGNSSTYFWAAEQFDVRDGYHFHALIRTPLNALDVFGWYFARYGRCQLIDNREPERQLAASYYTSKYITKKLTDYDIYFEKAIRHRDQIELIFPFT